MKTQKHQRLESSNKSSLHITTFLKKATSSQELEEESPSSSKGKPLDSFIESEAVLKSEIVWVLQCVMCNYSFNCNSSNNNIFKLMFPDSAIANKFQCGESKTSYICKFGLAPHFKKLLMNHIKQEPYYVLLFDESLNKITQTKQMDILARFWEGEQVKSRYLTLNFLGHATAEKMVNLDLFQTNDIPFT